jgi:hypothetical protein
MISRRLGRDRLEKKASLIKKIEALDYIPVGCCVDTRSIVLFFFAHDELKSVCCGPPCPAVQNFVQVTLKYYIMINGPPSSEASSSTTNQTTNRTDFKAPGQLSVPSLNGSQSIPHSNYAAWSSNFSGYATMTANPTTFGSYYASTTPYPTGYAPSSNLPYQSKSYNPYSHLFYKRNDNVKENPPISSTNQTGSATPSQVPGPPERAVTPPLPKPETFRHWDEVLKRFLEKTKMTEAVKGFENDMLVLNSEWEQKVIPDALKELANGLQVRVSSDYQRQHFIIIRPRSSWIVYQESQT